MRDCWPDWLKRRSLQTFGPGLEDAVPYPVYQVQPPAISSDNPNTTSAQITPAFFQSYANTVQGGNDANGQSILEQTIFQVNPNNIYDVITCVAWDLGGVETVPIFLSFDRPGRLNALATQTPDGPEVNIWIKAISFPLTLAAFDRSSMPTWISEAVIPKTSRTPYSSLYFETPCTNRPFYLWFAIKSGNNFDGLPNPGIAFKASWFTRGR